MFLELCSKREGGGKKKERNPKAFETALEKNMFSVSTMAQEPPL